MKTTLRIAILLCVLIALLAAPTAALAQNGGGDGKLVLGGTYRLNDGETLNGALAIFGGEATLEHNSRVNGDVALSGGTLTLRGEINGDIAVLGGTVFLEDTARVIGDINTLGGQVNRSPGAEVVGRITSGPNNLSLPIPNRGYLPNLNIDFDPIGNVLWAGFQSIVLAAIAVLIAMFLPRPLQRVADTIVAQPLVSGALGLMTVLVAPALILLLAITIILIPISLLAILALVVTWIFGIIALGTEVGRRLMASSNQTWTPPVAVGIGTLILALVTSFAAIIPCVGWIAPFVVGLVGIGGVLASRFGTQVYTGSGPRPSSSVAVYQTPVPPARPAEPFGEDQSPVI